MPSVSSAQQVGMGRRLGRVFRSVTGRTVILALDDALISGPASTLNEAAGLPLTCQESGADAVIAHVGTFLRQTIPGDLGRIVNLSASTSRSSPTRKVRLASVELAAQLDADVVAYQIHIGSRYESEMLRDASAVVAEATMLGLPTLLTAYARAESIDGSAHEFEALHADDPDEYMRLCVHCARIAVELGADVVKTHYPHSQEMFGSIVEACSPVPVLIAGGPQKNETDLLTMVDEALKAGASGVSIGRSVFLAQNPARVISAIVNRIHGDGY